MSSSPPSQLLRLPFLFLLFLFIFQIAENFTPLALSLSPPMKINSYRIKRFLFSQPFVIALIRCGVHYI